MYTGSVEQRGQSRPAAPSPTIAATESARRELTLGADVEQPGAQSHRDGEPGERRASSPCRALARGRTRCPTCRRAAGDRRAGILPEERIRMSPTISGDEQARRAAAARPPRASRAVVDCARRRGPASRVAGSPSCGVLPGAGHVRSEHLWLAPRRAAARRRSCRRTSPRCDRRARALGEVGRDEQDRFPGIARLAQPRVNELDRADVDAARRLRGEQHLERRAPSRARSRSSAGCRPRARAPRAPGRRGRMSNACDLAVARCRAIRVAVERARRA